MSLRVPVTVEPGTRLRRVADLLDQALDDLAGEGSSVPCSRCAAVLSKAAVELQFFASLFAGPEQERNTPGYWREGDRAALGSQLRALLPRLRKAERLLAAAAEFYRGWCAVGLPTTYPAAGYHTGSYYTDGWSHSPALVALEG